MGKKITDKVTWVGKVDWELRKFHGDEYSTHRGSSYNSYLIRDKKTVLIDTVWLPYDKEFVSRLKEEIDLNQIDYIIANHGEVDHSGSLPELLREIPGTPVYCTANAVKSIKGQYHEDWNFITVKTGDKLELGDTTLTFIEAPMLHWPDTMFTYMSGDNILFSNDGFGQHFASETLFNDSVDPSELYAEAIKYYANILTPFSQMVIRKINEIQGLGLPLDMICPSHGIIWKDNPMQIVEKYLKWADAYQENQITIVYDTMWNATRRMAETIAEGILEADPDVTVKLYSASKTDKTDIITEVFRSRAVVVGSPTVNGGHLYAIAGILELMRGMKFKKKKAAAFGSYGWSGEAVKIINEELEKAGFEVVDTGYRATWLPDENQLEQIREYGKQLATRL
ncbi:MAG: anaerobic nitric oxide reductase flavorubredoxin [Clostridiales bacterium]|jgi:anaerobic nitric oxide reductase flavorubredoxin|nr:anaerobic nitric oxide reductase flavorubredoxin [Clostridiales bacterium]